MSSQEVPVERMPPVVWERYKEILDLTEAEPVVHRSDISTMVLSHGNDRVRFTVKYRNHKNHKYQWEQRSSELFIDGEKVASVRHTSQYAAILADPDNGRHTWTPKGAKKANLSDLRELTEEQSVHAPMQIAMLTRLFRKMNATTDCSVSVLTNGINRYSVRIAAPGKTVTYLHLKPVAGDWDLDRYQIVNLGGYDLSEWYGDDAEDLILDAMGIASRKAQISFDPKAVSHGQAGKANSVAVRNNTVIRN
jgi:hypothetical protein